jgi:hypothetical protein
MEREQFWSLLDHVKEKATQMKDESVLNWLKNKEGDNSWVLKCVSRATSKMAWGDWYSTSYTTNIAESAHAHSQRDGTRLTLVSAVQRGRLLDQRFLEGENAAQTVGVISKYGNQSITGRTAKNLKRTKKAVKKAAKGDAGAQQQEAILARAQDLIYEGVLIDVVELFLKTEKQKQNSES